MNIGRQKLRFECVAIRGSFSALLLWAFTASGVATAAEKPRTTAEVSSNVSLVPVVGAAKADLLRSLVGAKNGAGTMSPDHHECPGGTPHVEGITCGSTTNDQLTSNGSCPLTDGSYVDFYSFSGTSGQQVTISLSATFDAFLFLLDPNATPAATDDDGGGGTNSRIVFTLTSTGTWFIAANAFDPNTFGAYTLTLTCGSAPAPGACTANSTTLCLNNNRFRVRATFATPQGQAGDAIAVPETSDTGLFWFFSANNIEAIVKVINACSFAAGPRYWVFAGGLTNVQVVLTVTDTQMGEVRTYSNLQGTPFAPIQDTNAFATCP
jgi:hypothetical protein